MDGGNYEDFFRIEAGVKIGNWIGIIRMKDNEMLLDPVRDAFA